MLWDISRFSMAALLLISLLGCIDEDAFELPNFDQNSCGGASDDLSGIWTISGEGKRSDCREDFLNTDRLTISSLDIPIDHDTSTNRLSIGDANFAENFRIEDSRVSGACVNFTTVESTGGAEIRYEWEGEVRGAEIVGEFKGFGPKTCVTEGEFTVQY